MPTDFPDSLPGALSILLTGDVMIGRGVDQVLPDSVDPELREHWRGLVDARTLVQHVEAVEGPFPPRERRSWDHPWGDFKEAFDPSRSHLRFTNLECALTTHDGFWPDKRIHFRAHPQNVACLSSASISACSLANNHLLDFDREGLRDTLNALAEAGIHAAGAGKDLAHAWRPVVFDLGSLGRLGFLSFATPSSLVPKDWAAGRERSGIAQVRLQQPMLSKWTRSLRVFRERLELDLMVVSIHWGENWPSGPSDLMRHAAHRMIEDGSVDLIHGHSSHHVLGVEVHQGKAILYGCGDWVNDYEATERHREVMADRAPKDREPDRQLGRRKTFNGDLGALFRVELDPNSGKLRRLMLLPTRQRGFRPTEASRDDRTRLAAHLNQQSKTLGSRFSEDEAGRLVLDWREAPEIPPLES